MTLKTRQPTRKKAPPVVLVEGETGAGKSWVAAELSASPKVGRTYWLEVGECTADEYGAIPGARYEIVEHDGTWAEIYGQVIEARVSAQGALDAGAPPDVLVLDQGGAIWDMLSEWADNRARSSTKNKKKLAEDPNADIDITANYWNDATGRWRKLMTAILTFPGIVIVISRGRETALFQNGQPVAGKKDYKVEGQKGITADIPIWVRMTRDGNPLLIKMRSVTNGIKPGDRPLAMPGFTLEGLIFERYGYQPEIAQSRQIVTLVPGSDAPLSERAAVLELAVQTAPSGPHLRAVYKLIGPAFHQGEISKDEGEYLVNLITKRGTEVTPAGTDEAPDVDREPAGAPA